jgi:DNA polymerase-1
VQQPDNAVVFVTLDKDMGQALTLGEQIYLLDAFKDQFTDTAAMQTKMEFSVEKMPFYFALLGDASDNIPGVKGIGKKTAVDLVNQFDSLEDMYDRLHEIKKAGVKTALLEQKDNAFLSFQLFLLQYHTLNMSPEQLLFSEKNKKNAGLS